MGLLRHEKLTSTDIAAIVGVACTLLIWAFCTTVFCLVCRKQRKTKKAMQKMHEEQRMPFVGHQCVAPAGAQSNPAEILRCPQKVHDQQQHGPLELQGSGRPDPLPPQQLDGYVAAVRSCQTRATVEAGETDVQQPTFNDARPFELPTNAVHPNTDSKHWRYK